MCIEAYHKYKSGWTFKGLNASKGFINCSLDSILDSDMRNYNNGSNGELTDRYRADITGKDVDELCIKSYVWKTNQMTHLKLSKRKNLYLDICQSCKQFFADDEECINSSLNLSLHSTVITVPMLSLEYEQRNMSNQSIIINFPVTYILSKLVSSLINLDSYNEDQMNYTCTKLLGQFIEDIEKRKKELPYHLGVFSIYVNTHFYEMKRLFSKNTNINKNKTKKDCKHLMDVLTETDKLNHKLLNKTKKKFLENQKNKVKIENYLLSIINVRQRDARMNEYISHIYDFAYKTYNIIEGIKQIYNDEHNRLLLTESETPELFYLRNNDLIKNTCSVHIIATLSWFFNQIHMGMYNKQKSVLDIYIEKFTPENISKLIKSIYNYKKNYKKNVLNICSNVMNNVINIVESVLVGFFKHGKIFNKNNVTFSNIIKFTEITILRSKLIDILNFSIFPSLSHNKLSNGEIRQKENLICLMKNFSDKMNSYFFALKSGHLKKLFLENYEKYDMKDDTMSNSKDLYFCSKPGKYFIHKIVVTKMLFLINIYT
ncbi:conserved Plasmodium protein, unknown function [Plasmodium ovale curtisi]|uniref:Uncharacterized protein n=1 Tax=Plasmodium ovale curtisi TaxID=864141 RepID=A0A1A8WMK2_PLAOA|nr:conserved Plasmodium protein, unknown function [Plasmodium ovale curtisi]